MPVTLSDCPYCKGSNCLHSSGDKEWDETSCECQIGMNYSTIYICVICNARIKQFSSNSYTRLKSRPLPRWLNRKLENKQTSNIRFC